MKKTLALSTCFLFTAFLSFSQSPTWLWAANSSGNGLETGYCVASDKSSNAYITGSYVYNITFGATTLNDVQGSTDIFVAKYDSSGNAIWAKTAGGNMTDEAYAVTADKSGNVYVTGYFQSPTITFGSIVLNTIKGGYFLAKYDKNGTIRWVKHTNNLYYTISDQGSALTTDSIGNVYITGIFHSDSITLGNFTLHNTKANQSDIFLAKYDSSGTVLWARKMGGKSNDFGTGITIDKSGYVYLAGWFESDTLRFDSTQLYNPNFASNPNNIFLAKYDGAGNLLWAKSADGSVFNGETYGVTTDGAGNVYFTGYFNSDSVRFGNSTVYKFPNPIIYYNLFVYKCDSSGNAIWAKSCGGNTNVVGSSIAADEVGNVYLLGGFDGDTIYFDSTAITQPLNSSQPMVVFTLGPAGNILCSDAFLSGGNYQNGICLDNAGNAYIGGNYGGSTIFYIGNDTLTQTGTQNIFVARFHCEGSITTEVKNLTENTTIQIFPNPFNSNATIKYNIPTGSKNAMLIIYDQLGRQRCTYKLSNTEGQIEINAIDLSCGIYFCALVVDGKNVVTRKMVTQE